MLEDAIDPRPPTDSFERLLGACTLLNEALARDPDAIARNWNDRETHWGNLRDFRHWIERARLIGDGAPGRNASEQMSGPLPGARPGRVAAARR